MKTKKSVELKVWVIAMLFIGFTSGINVKAQCGYKPVLVVCHNDPGSTNWYTGGCCGGSGSCGTIIDGVPGESFGFYIVNPSVGLIGTCGWGGVYPNDYLLGITFTGICGWQVSGSTCGTPWGPIPVTAPYDINPCGMQCGNG